MSMMRKLFRPLNGYRDGSKRVEVPAQFMAMFLDLDGETDCVPGDVVCYQEETPANMGPDADGVLEGVTLSLANVDHVYVKPAEASATTNDGLWAGVVTGGNSATLPHDSIGGTNSRGLDTTTALQEHAIIVFCTKGIVEGIQTDGSVAANEKLTGTTTAATVGGEAQGTSASSHEHCGYAFIVDAAYTRIANASAQATDGLFYGVL